MVLDPSWYEISNGVSGLFFMALGLLVGRVRAGSASNRAFALFAVAFGAGVVILNLVLPGHPILPTTAGESAAMLADAILWLSAAAGLVWLAVATRGGNRRNEIPWAAVSILIVIGYLGLVVARPLDDRSGVNLLFFTSFQALLGIMWGLSALFAYRFTVASEQNAAGYATMSAALVLYPAFWAAIQFALGVWGNGARELTLLNTLFFLGPAFFISALWSVVFMRSSGPRARMARNVVWLSLGATLTGLLAAGTADGSEHWGYGAARFLAVGLLAFAIVRGQAPGIDGRLRFGVSRSTIAGAFVAVFFVVSEGAQIVLGQDSQILGLLAAGALVFVLSPLQRAAERFAEKAVPSTPPSASGKSEGTPADPEDIFRQALRIAIRDGRLTREEEVRCAELAESLGIGAGRAAALMLEVVRDSEQVA